MKNQDIDKILGTGLIIALLMFIFGQFVCIVIGREPLPMEIANTIITGVVAYMGKILFRKEDSHADSKPPTPDRRDDSEGARYSASITLPERKS